MLKVGRQYIVVHGKTVNLVDEGQVKQGESLVLADDKSLFPRYTKSVELFRAGGHTE